MDSIGRRDFLGRCLGLGVIGGASISPGVSRAQQSVPIVGFLHYGSRLRTASLVSAFWQRLNQAGFSENRNIAAVYGWGEGHDERLPALAFDLLQRGASIIVAGGAPSAAAARRSTATIPIIFVAASAPVGGEFDLNLPEKNITGVSLASPDLLAARFQALLKLAPAVRSVAALVNPQTPNIDVQLQYLSDEATRRGIAARIINASGEAELAAALGEIAQRRQDALLVANDGFLNGGRAQLVAATSRMPAAFANREFVEAGGLLSYGPSLTAAYQQAGAYAARILKGEKPVDLPIEHPFEMEVALNAAAAAALGLPIPSELLAVASEVIK